MAKQSGKYLITGTIDELTFYKMYGQYYVRMKSSLTRNRVRKSPAFARTMKSAREMAAASVIASQVYRTIAKDKRKVAWYRKMTGMAKVLFAKGESKERIFELLEKYIMDVSMVKESTARVVSNIRKLFVTSKPQEKTARISGQAWKHFGRTLHKALHPPWF